MTLTVIRSRDQIWLSDVICLDVDRLGGIREAAEWIDSNSIKEGTLVLAALGEKGGDMAPLSGRVVGVTNRPEDDSQEGWEKQVRPLVKAIRNPDLVDEIPLDECMGGVSRAEFRETLRRTAMSPDDPEWQD